MNKTTSVMTNPAWVQPTDREVLIEVLEKYIYGMRQLNCNQAAIEAHEALLDRLEKGEPIT